MGYSTKRFANYDVIFRHYMAVPDLVERIIVVWNNQLAAPPQLPTDTENVEVLVLRRGNSLNNRFFVYGNVSTQMVLVIDDDVVLDTNLVRNMISAFKQDPKRIIGLDGRYISLLDGAYFFHRGQYHSWSCVVTKTMLFHKDLLLLYGDFPRVHEQVDQWFNCEDVAFASIAAMHTGVGPILLDAEGRSELPSPDGLSTSMFSADWQHKRTQCVHWLGRYFGVRTPFHMQTSNEQGTADMLVWLSVAFAEVPWRVKMSYGKGGLIIYWACFAASIFGVLSVCCLRPLSAIAATKRYE